MNNAGMSLDELLKAGEEEEIELSGKKDAAEAVASLNAEIPASTMRDLRMISAYTDKTIKDIVAAQLTRFVKRAKKKMMEEITKDSK